MAETKAGNLLLITLSNIGDVIATTPVIASLRASFPEARLTVVVGPKAAPLLEKSRQIDRLLVYDKRRGWSHKFWLLRTLREDFYDWVVDLRNSAIPYLVRASRRSPIFRSRYPQNVKERHLEILRRMKLPVQESGRFDFFDEEDEQTLLKKWKDKSAQSFDSCILISPGAASEVKRWGTQGFQEVIQRFLKTSSEKIVLVGSPEEASLCNELFRIDSNRIVNLAGVLTLRELAALTSRAKLVLTNDSAVMHLGYELNRPVVALFGPTHHKKYGRENKIWRVVREFPPCAPCEKAQCQIERRTCLDDLPSEKVFRACEELLSV